MFVTKLKIKNFRCFSCLELDFSKRFVFLQGENGSGKTSILEALHFACYLRSFRANSSKELMQLANDKYFFIDVKTYQEKNAHTIQVGVSDKEKIVKLDKQVIKSYKELIQHYRVITLVQDDIQLIKGIPELRRSFLNQSLNLAHPCYRQNLRTYKHLLAQRNMILSNHHIDLNELQIWTKKLWHLATKLQEQRTEYLVFIEKNVNRLLTHIPSCKEIRIVFEYIAKGMGNKRLFNDFWHYYYTTMAEKERYHKRSLFGAHLDDFTILFEQKKARIYASRGQQKLITFLIKLAQLDYLADQSNSSILLLDDFLTDFDDRRFQECLALLINAPYIWQIFITTPQKSLKNILAQISDVAEIIQL